MISYTVSCDSCGRLVTWAEYSSRDNEYVEYYVKRGTQVISHGHWCPECMDKLSKKASVDK